MQCYIHVLRHFVLINKGSVTSTPCGICTDLQVLRCIQQLLYLASAVQFGSVVMDVDEFDSDCFQISATESTAMDPQQRLLLEGSQGCMQSSATGPAGARAFCLCTPTLVGSAPRAVLCAWPLVLVMITPTPLSLCLHTDKTCSIHVF